MMFSMNFFQFVLLSFIILNSTGIKIDFLSIKQKIESKYYPQKDFKLPNTQILLKGWLKFASSETQNTFYENPYYSQSDNEKSNAEDTQGLINIPSKNHFFFLLTNSSINILTARKEKITKVFEVIKINEIKDNDKNAFIGGIENYGDFKEGFCFNINMKNEDKITICSDTQIEKEKWMNSIYKLKQNSDSILQFTQDNNDIKIKRDNLYTITNQVIYEKCKMKQGDMAYVLPKSLNKSTFKKKPVNVVLTNKTISIYEESTHSSPPIIEYSLSELIKIKHYHRNTLSDDSCLLFGDMENETILCALYPSYSENKKEFSLENTRDLWLEDLLYFTKSCGEFYSKDLNSREPNKIEKDLNISKIQSEIDSYSLNEKEREDMIKVLTQTQALAIKALEKEIFKEELIEKEEEEREKKIEREFQKKINELSKQVKSIDERLSEKKKEAETKNLLNQKIKKITLQVKEQIEKNREELKERMKNKKKEIDQKTASYHKQINELKQKISLKMYQANKIGNVQKCNPNKSIIEIESYCSDNFFNSTIHEDEEELIKECLDKNKYCYVCCDNEFGEFHLEKRTNCHSSCDDYYFEMNKKNNINQKNIFNFKQLDKEKEKIELLKSIKLELSK